MNRLKKTLLLLAAIGPFVISGCSSASNTPSKTDKPNETQISTPDQNQAGSDEEDLEDDIELDAQDVDGNSVDLSSYDSNIRISNGGSYAVSGSLDHTLVVDADDGNVELTLKDATLNPEDGPGLYVRNAKSVTIHLDGNSTITQNGANENPGLNAALYSKDDLVIDGYGSLSISSKAGHGIKAKDKFDLKDAALDITAEGDGIHVNEEGTFNGPLKIQAQDEGVDGKTSLAIQSGSISIDSDGDCIRAQETLTVQGGELNLISRSNEGLESKDVLSIEGGTIEISAMDDGLNAKNELIISGGDLKIVSSSNDAIDSNGDLIISGGSIQAYAKKQPEGAFDVDNTPFVISGGDIIGIGPVGTMPTDARQNVLMIGGSGSIDSVSILDDSGSIILEASDLSPLLSGGSSALLFSSPKMKTGMTVTVQVNGNAVTEVELSQGLNTVGQIPTMGGGQPGMQR